MVAMVGMVGMVGMSRVWRIEPADSERDQRRAAAALTARGLVAGDRVAMALPNSPALLAAILGACRIGIVPVLINATLLPAEIDALVSDADPKLTLRTPADLATLGAGAKTGAGRGVDLAPVPLCRPMHFTSGTSGRPKGVWPGVLSETEAIALHEDEAAVWELGPSDVHLTCSPLYHSVAVRFSAQALLRGAAVVLLEKFDAATVAAAIPAEGVRSVFMVPTHLQRLLDVLDRDGGADNLRGLRKVVHAGAACPAALKHRLFETLGTSKVWEFYGSTEGQCTVCPPDEWLAHPGTVGKARIGRRLEVDQDQTIWCEVPSFARWAYWRDPVKTEAAWRGAMFTVGDLGRLDGDGYLYLDGRRDDLIISGGMNVYPAEVEHALADVPGVVEVAVFGVADEEWGQRVCAAVIGDVLPDAVVAHARDALAGYKRPKQVYIVEDLPRTGTGKVRRTQVAATLGLEP